MLDFNKKYEYRFRISFRTGSYEDIIYLSDKDCVDEAMTELLEAKDKHGFIFASKVKKYRPLYLNTFDIRSIEFMHDKYKV